MIKQLYTRKIAVFIGAALFGMLLSILPGCAQENNDSGASATPETSTEMTFLDHDMVLGDTNAPVEMIEYASLTCVHCAEFQKRILPEIKEKYVDTGKLKIVMRSFLLNAIDAQATLLTRCVPEKRYFKFMEALFTLQDQWYDIPEYQRLTSQHDTQTANRMFVEHTMGEVEKMARQIGLNKSKIDACLTDQKIADYVFSVHRGGIEQYKVNATPTIIVNGNKVNLDLASVENAIEAALK